MINVNGREIETDAEGYLASLDDWSEDVAKCLAERDQLDLGDEHWMVVRWIRDYYAENGTAPNLRVMSKLIGGALGEQFGDKKYLFDLFPYGPGQAGGALRRHAQAHRLRLRQSGTGCGGFSPG
jgi:TusE/DsrC/DsvC family sulfur relay protein